MCKGKDRRSLGKGSINTSIVMRTRWRKVAFLMTRSRSRKIKRAIDPAMRRIPTISTIIPASKPPTQQAAARKLHHVNNSSAPRSR